LIFAFHSFYLCLTAPITISSTTPARSTPKIKIIKGEKLLKVSELVLAISLAKFVGNAMNVNIFGRASKVPALYDRIYLVFGNKVMSERMI
jgi:hypothetical protein